MRANRPPSLHIPSHALVFANTAASNRLRRPSPSSPQPLLLLSKGPHDRSSFSPKHHNKHPLVEHFLTSHNAPPRVQPPIPAFSRLEACLPPSALSSTFVAYSSP